MTVTSATLESIAVTPANPSIAKGLTEQFTATGTYSDNSTGNISSQVTWVSLNMSAATINSGGLATAVGVGSSTISAILGSVSGSTILTVTPATLVSIAVTPANPSVTKGATQQFTATGTYTDNSTQDLTTQVSWMSGTTSVATITGTGLASTLGVGQSLISATLGQLSGSTTLTVTAATLVSIAVTPANPSIAKGLTEQFTATGTYSDNSTANLTGQVTWASATTTVATINAAGLASAVGTGTSTISATLDAVHGSTTLTVTPAVLASIAVTPANPSIAKGLTEQFTATGTLTDGSTENLTNSATWASATTSVATINSTGLATAVGTGMSTISATLGSIRGNTKLTVTAATLVSIAVTLANTSVPKGLTEQFTATGTYTDNSMQNLTGQVTWASGTTSVATINATGLASAVGTGMSSIMATLGQVSGSTILTVTAPVLASIAVTPFESIDCQRFDAAICGYGNLHRRQYAEPHEFGDVGLGDDVRGDDQYTGTGNQRRSWYEQHHRDARGHNRHDDPDGDGGGMADSRVIQRAVGDGELQRDRQRAQPLTVGDHGYPGSLLETHNDRERVESLGGVTATGLSGLGTTTLTWTINPIALGNFATTLAGSGPNALMDAQGDGLAGGSGFSQALKILWGDFNDDGVVNASDLALVNAARSQTYNQLADMNGDGAVDANDVKIVQSRLNTMLP